MKITYESKDDVLRFVFSEAPIDRRDEERPGLILDCDKDGNVVILTILWASERVDNPRSVEFAVMA